MNKQTTQERFITVGFMGEADIDKQATPEETFTSLCDISEQCGYFTSRGEWSNYLKEIIIQTNEGIFHLKYDKFGENFEFKGVYKMVRIQ